MIGINTAILALGFLWTVYVAWKNLRSDYDEKEILTLMSLLGIVGMIVGYALLIREWGVMLPVFGVLVWWCRKYHWHLGEWLDVLVPCGIVVAAVSMKIWALLLIYIGVMLIKRNYRQFSWYKSGKPGLIGLSGLAGWAMVRISIGFFKPSIDQWIGVWLLTICLVAIYLLSGYKFVWPQRKTQNQ